MVDFVFLALARYLWKNKSYPQISQHCPLQDLQSYPERVVPGSAFAKAQTVPKCQARISVDRGDGFTFSGQGFMANGWFWTATHVVADSMKTRLETALGMVEIDSGRFRVVDGEISVLELYEADRTKLGLSNFKFVEKKVDLADGVVVQVSDGERTSMGVVGDMVGFGLMEYRGSTIRGFSGAPYCVNKTVYGMHVASTPNFNMGIQGAYIRSFSRLEDSEDFLLREIKRGAEMEIRQAHNLDEYKVLYKGRYFIMDAEEVDEAIKRSKRSYDVSAKTDVAWQLKESALNDTEDLPRVPRAFCEWADNQGNLLRPEAVVASGASLKHPIVPAQNIPKSTQMDSLSRPVSPNSMDGHELTHAQPREVLPCTLESTKRRRQMQRNRRKKSLGERPSVPTVVIPPGAQN